MSTQMRNSGDAVPAARGRAPRGTPPRARILPPAAEALPLATSSPFASEVPGERHPTRRERLFWVLGPAAFLLAGYLLCGVFTTWGHANEVLGVAGLSFFGLGTSVILGPAAWGPNVLKGLSTWDLAVVVMWLSVATAFLFSYNLDLLHRLPVVGPWLERARAGAVNQLSCRPWIRRWAAAGVAFFVFLPLPASGTIGGSIIGRLLGLPRFSCFLAVALGSIAAAAVYAVAGQELDRWSRSNDFPAWVRIAAVVGVLLLVALLARFAAKSAKRAR